MILYSGLLFWATLYNLQRTSTRAASVGRQQLSGEKSLDCSVNFT